tara:strand:+ start:210 stop:452 length:243 start_codon:yes stop_codon:yes gene_type:complete
MSSIDCIADRFAKLRTLREKLCSQEHNWAEAFKARDWVVEQLQSMKKLIEDPNASKEDILHRVEDLLCVLDPKQNGSDDD